MPLQLYNTLHAKKETFQPLDPDRVTMYVCGPTVYNYIHIGNARPAVVFDVLNRVLKQHYKHVIYARNITDIDDKIIAAAKENGENIATLAKRFTDTYHDDLTALYNEKPTLEPLATDNIDEMIAMIKSLIERGHAYEAEGHVLFHIPSNKSYGQLSKRSLDDMIVGARIEVAPYKKHPADFVMWKPSDDDIPGWDSPWGRGRPGWHIECSAMIRKHLGGTIDIHGGGQDLTFPHHENELAQGSCCADNEQYVRYWVHNGYVTIDEEKMSKSTGNVRQVHALLKNHDGEVLRLALLSTHYRSPLNWSEDLITQARNRLDSIYQALRTCQQSAADTDVIDANVQNALEDDLNTPLAISALHECAHQLNKSIDPDEQAKLKARIINSGCLLGLLQRDADAYFKSTNVNSGLDETTINNLLAERDREKLAKNYARADEIRNQLTAANIELEDTKDGTRWRYGG
ncbi:MAG: cysteine--tRNA ligase [Gammaproteobacteria bacterium]|nr:cysteine--tRNA ligase [Gammaproteobacteria bacterium]